MGVELFDGLPDGGLSGGHITQSNSSTRALGYVKSAVAHAPKSQVKPHLLLSNPDRSMGKDV